MLETLTHTSVRYIKNGVRGKWWPAARDNNQVHAGWSFVPVDLILQRSYAGIERLILDHSTDRGAATRDLAQLRSLLEDVGEHIWITFEDGCMWWCTLRSGVIPNPAGHSDDDHGHFWLECDKPWSNRSNGGRLLAIADLPGTVTSTSGFRGTVCTPGAEASVLRIIRDECDPVVDAAREARKAYQEAIEEAVQGLGPRDFEDLIDLILVRSGWARVSTLGKTQEGVDLEVENVAANEVAFVQVKGAASQVVLDDYVRRFNERRERYDRMIFAVHSPRGRLRAPTDTPVQVWSSHRLAHLVVRAGLGEWVEKKVG